MSHLIYYAVRFHIPFKVSDTKYALITTLTHKTLPSALKEATIEALVMRCINPDGPFNSLANFEWYHKYSQTWRPFCAADHAMPCFKI